LDYGDRLNVSFHLAMYATCTALRSARPKRPTIANLDMAKVNDDLFGACITQVLAAYVDLGGNDRVAKGPVFAERLRVEIQERFSRVPGSPEPGKAGGAVASE